MFCYTNKCGQYPARSLNKHRTPLPKITHRTRLTKTTIEQTDQPKDKPRVRNLYSFATKYRSFHQPEVFPMFDSFVEKALWYFRQNDEFHPETPSKLFPSFKKYQLRQYSSFVGIVNGFKECYDLTNCTYQRLIIICGL